MMASVILLSGCAKTSGKRDEEREKELKALREENERLKEQPQEPPKKKLFGIF